MARTVTLRLPDETYRKIADYSKAENRPISNFIETATVRYMEEQEFTDDTETAEILSNTALIKRLKEGSRDARQKKGRFITS